MARPPSDLDDYLEWKQRLERQKESGLSLDVFCLQEGVSKSTYYRWADRLRNGIPEAMTAENAAREKAESGDAAFVPITLKASPVEIQLPQRRCRVTAARCWAGTLRLHRMCSAWAERRFI
jgi:hypothetical protein